MTDAGARRRIAEDLDATLIVEAAAGTGKTSALVGRMVAVLAAGVGTLQGMLAATFSDKAAGEMKLKLRAELEKARGRAEAGARQRLDAALADLEAARIGTLHGLCGDLLREYPVEAGIDPRYEVVAEEEARRLEDQAFDAWLSAELAAPREGVRRVLRRRPRGRRGGETPRQMLRKAARARIAHRDFTTPWRRVATDRSAMLAEARARLAALEWPGNLARWRLADIGRREAVTGPDDDALEADLFDLGDDAGPAADLLARVDADLAACLFEELGGVVERYEALKAAAGKLDFLDLLLRCRDLVRDRQDVRRSLARRVSHIFVDEFQDTDPVQAELLFLLAMGDGRPPPGKLFVVGDPKQSIYRFRRADLVVYEQMKARLVELGAEVVQLSTSFRSTPSIQRAVNAAFAPRMLGGPGQAGYVALSPSRDEAEHASVRVLPAPVRAPLPAMEASYADAVGALVARLVEEGFTVGERGARVPLAPRHVCLLFKRFSAWGGVDVTLPYARALEARGVAHVLVGGRSFHQREEVMAVRTALAAVEWPDDTLAVYAALRGPFFAIADEELLAYRFTAPPEKVRGDLHPLRPRGDGKVAVALAALGELHRSRNYRPIADTLSRLLERSRAHVGLALWQGGEQALANVLRLLDHARRFEAAGTTSFRAFVERLADEAEEGEGGEAPVVEEGTEGVRLMTVHKAKGLEFPVVVLCDPSAKRSLRRASRLLDDQRRLWLEPLCGCAPIELIERAAEAIARDEEEGVRLAYVAATRARDLLVVPALGHRAAPGWLDVLDPALPAATWIDVSTLRLGVALPAGVRREELLGEGEAAEEGRALHAAWLARREQVTHEGAKATLASRPARKVGMTPRQPVGVERLPVVSRPGGRRFGTLVHAVLAMVPLDGDPRAMVAAQARLLGAPEDERDAAARAVAAALAHPLYGRARAAEARGELRRESPVFLRLPDGAVAEGVVDLVFREDGRWVIVEVKTDAELDDTLVRSEAQVAVYVEAVEAATGEPAQGIIFVV